MPVVTLALHGFMALCMDLDRPERNRNRYLVIAEALVWNIAIQGCLQPLAALFVALLICPAISFVILTGTIFYSNLYFKQNTFTLLL